MSEQTYNKESILKGVSANIAAIEAAIANNGVTKEARALLHTQLDKRINGEEVKSEDIPTILSVPTDAAEGLKKFKLWVETLEDPITEVNRQHIENYVYPIDLSHYERRATVSLRV